MNHFGTYWTIMNFMTPYWKTTFIGDDYENTITAFKKKPGKLILMFGSATSVHSLMKHDLIDEFWLLINLVMLGDGIPLFANSTQKK